jgi:hypothetical protein
MPKAYQFPFLLVPQIIGHRLEAVQNGHSLHFFENGVGAVAALEVIVGNARAEVVDVVKTDIPSEPL